MTLFELLSMMTVRTSPSWEDCFEVTYISWNFSTRLLPNSVHCTTFMINWNFIFIIVVFFIIISLSLSFDIIRAVLYITTTIITLLFYFFILFFMTVLSIWIGRVDGKAGLSSALIVWFGIKWFAVLVEPITITRTTNHLIPNQTFYNLEQQKCHDLDRNHGNINNCQRLPLAINANHRTTW